MDRRTLNLFEVFLERQDELLDKQKDVIAYLSSLCGPRRRRHRRAAELIWSDGRAQGALAPASTEDLPLGPFSEYDLQLGLWVPEKTDVDIADDYAEVERLLGNARLEEVPSRSFDFEDEDVLADNAADRLQVLLFFKGLLLMLVLNLGNEWMMALAVVFVLHSLRVTDPFVWLFRYLRRMGRERPLHVVLDELRAEQREIRAQRALGALLPPEAETEAVESQEVRPWTCFFYQTVWVFVMSLFPWWSPDDRFLVRPW